MTNRLADERSAYLRSAASQPVHWLPWSDAAFEKARQEGRPILLDIGAVWCHWCHVMDHESYDDPAVAEVLNRDFVCIKVDRDERPDVDVRYQRAISAISGQGGWPLTGFLTPEGEVFYGGTYFPPDTRLGRPGFRALLTEIARVYREDREKISKNAAAVRDAVERSLDEGQPGDVEARTVDVVTDQMARTFDFRHGGFGPAPKFPHPAAVDLALARWHDTGAAWLQEIVTRTLDGMAKGGIYDQVGGGFHRYSVDDRWVVPHFEKMACDNAMLLGTYLDAYAAFGEPVYRAVAEGVARWALDVLRDPTTGLFGGSQDADIGPDDDGDYFTWTPDEARAVLDEEEWTLVERVYDIYATGEMHHRPGRNVLFISKQPVEDGERALLERAKEKLKAARDRRPAPFVDRTPYTEWNAMLAAALAKGAAVLDRPDLDAAAVHVADAIWHQAWDADRGMSHVIGEPEPRGILGDQVHATALFVSLFEATGGREWLERAERVMDRCWERYWDEGGTGGFVDRERDAGGTGFLAKPAKPLQDASGPSGNGAAALVLAHVAELTGGGRWQERRDRALRAFAGRLADYHVFAATFTVALDWAVHPATHIVVVGDRADRTAEELHRLARASYRPRKAITRLRPSEVATVGLPTHIQAMLGAGRAPAAYLCEGTSCREPVATARELEDLLAAPTVVPSR